MKLLLPILLFLSLTGNSQFGNKNFFGITPNPIVAAGFNWDNLTPMSPTHYTSCSGTLEIINKSFTNLNPSSQNGSNIKIEATGCDITFRNCYFGPSIGVGAYIRQSTGTIRFINCLFASNSGGVFGEDCNGVNIQMDSCEIINPHGARNCRGQILQLANVTTANSYLKNSRGESFRGEGYTEDWVSLYISTGTANPITISSDMVRGGGPSTSGGGFMTGDSGGENQLVENNKLMNPGNYILACSGGNDIVIQNNLGYQSTFPWMNIAMYAYNVAAPSCNTVTVQGNGMSIPNGNYFYNPGGSESCGDITGVGPEANPNIAFQETNLIDITLAELNFPTILITFVDEDRLWHIRDESVQFANPSTSDCPAGKPAQLARPTSNAGADQSINVSTATLSGSGSTSTDGFNYQWVQVSGPNTATMSAPLAVTNNLSGLIDGTYQFRLQVCNNSGACDASWMTITVNLP